MAERFQGYTCNPEAWSLSPTLTASWIFFRHSSATLLE